MHRHFYFLILFFGHCKLAMALGIHSEQRILSCLGKEEYALHKLKHTTQFFPPYYRLNRLIINEVSGLADLKLKKQVATDICSGRRPVSEAFLRELLLNGKDIFEVTQDSAPEERPYLLNAIEELDQKAPIIFFQYLSDLQSQAPTPECLFESIPHLQYFHDQFHYLEVELTPEKIIAEKDKLSALFKGLDKLPETFRRCKQKIQKSAAKKTVDHKKKN